MEQIILEHTVIIKLNALIDILIDKEYFSYLENAETYVHKLYDFIDTIPSQPRRRTKLPRYGQYYCRYKANAQTSYYITFDVVQDYYFIKNIISSHTRQYPVYIKGL